VNGQSENAVVKVNYSVRVSRTKEVTLDSDVWHQDNLTERPTEFVESVVVILPVNRVAVKEVTRFGVAEAQPNSVKSEAVNGSVGDSAICVGHDVCLLSLPLSLAVMG
jgi:hypothetical protein